VITKSQNLDYKAMEDGHFDARALLHSVSEFWANLRVASVPRVLLRVLAAKNYTLRGFCDYLGSHIVIYRGPLD
jgi:hypothetical protein